MYQFREFRFPSADGVHTCYACEWAPEGGLRGVVQIVHGVAEHIGRYDPVARFLAQQGFLVCGEDHLGHGKTVQDGKYGSFAPKNGWKLVVADIAALRDIQGKKYSGVPYFILGHSMGSFLTRTYLIDHPGAVDGAVLSGTGQEPGAVVAVGKLLAGLECRRLGWQGVSPLVTELSLGAYNRKFRPNRTSADWLSRDEGAVDAYLADPLCRNKSSVSMFRDMMGGLNYISRPENLAKMDPRTPVYLFSGDQDPVGGMGKGVKKVYGYFQKQGVGDLTLKLYPGGRHEMFNEVNRQEVLEDLLLWLERHI